MNFSDLPGPRERHLKRRHNNPLFGGEAVSAQQLEQALQQDLQEYQQFMTDFHQLVSRAAELEENAEADQILKIKEQLDKAYETVAGLAGDQNEIKEMIGRLIRAVMQAMWKGIGQDFQAQSKLRMEEEARQAHFAMLEHKLVVDLLRPDELVREDELVPALLSDDVDSACLALQLFMPEQQAVICHQAEELVASLAPGEARVRAEQQLLELQKVMQTANTSPF